MALAAVSFASPSSAKDASVDFYHTFQPLVAEYCIVCHDQYGAQESGLDIEALNTPEKALEDLSALAEILERLESGSMPPAESDQPSEAERKKLISYLQQTIITGSDLKLNDPGVVVMPRLNHNEYNRVVEQLTGRSIDAAKYLPKDPQGGEGFLNVGYEHAVTAGQIEKYLDAANYTLKHAVVTPERGIRWHNSPLSALGTPGQLRTFLVNEWVEVFRDIEQDLSGSWKNPRQGVDWSNEDILFRLWKHRSQIRSQSDFDFAALGESEKPNIPGHFLKNWWMVLTSEDLDDKRFARFRDDAFDGWHNLPESGSISDKQAMETIRRELTPLRRIELGRASGSEQEKQVDFFGNRNAYLPPGSDVYFTINTAGESSEDAYAIITKTEFRFDETGATGDRWAEHWKELVSLDGRRFQWGKSVNGVKVSDVEAIVSLPVTFKIPVPKGCKAIRVNAKLTEKLTPEGRAQAFFTTKPPTDDDLVFKKGESLLGVGYAFKAWDRLNTVRAHYGVPGKKYTRHQPYLRFHEFNRFPLRYLDAATWNGCELKDGQVVSRADAEILGGDPTRPRVLTARQLRNEAPAKDREKLDVLEQELELAAQMPWQDVRTLLLSNGLETAVEGDLPTREQADDWSEEDRRRYREIWKELTVFEKRLESKARPIVEEFAGRAWRRQAQSDEIDRMMEAYRAERRIGGSFDASVKQAIKAVMVSPDFLFRPSSLAGTPGPEIRPLSDLALAHRMAFVLWGAGPDDELLQAAADGKLGNDDSIRRHVRRMLRDEKSEALATDFVGQWLGFADFHLHTRPNPDRFPEYDAELRQAMYQEIVRFVHDLFASDRPVMDLIQADYTFANDRLAEFYGLPKVKGDRFRQVSIPESLQSQRGGIFGMGAVLTRTSTALRTSPVLRGAWLYREVLGNPMPEPPPDVPMISADETDDEGRSIAQQLAKHRESAVCASCHDRIDPPGVVLEHFDPIGQWRQTYLSGSPIDVKSELQSGEQIDGLVGLRQYLQGRRDRFATQFAKKFLAYALGRQLLLTDKPLIDQMVTSLESEDYRPSSLIEAAILSQQFRTRRDLQDLASTER